MSSDNCQETRGGGDGGDGGGERGGGGGVSTQIHLYNLSQRQ